MSETARLFAETAERLFAEEATRAVKEAAESGTYPEKLWRVADAAGLLGALVPEDAGGAGANWAEAHAIVRAAGAHGVPAPVGETILAAGLLAACGIAIPDGPLTVLPGAMEISAQGVSGMMRRVPWGRVAKAGIAVSGGRLLLVDIAEARVTPGVNLAREPRDDLALDGARVMAAAALPAHWSGDVLFQAGATLRAAQMAGAIGRVLEMTVRYAGERVQFGRPIARFQAVQQSLAMLAGEAAAAARAAEAAFAALDSGPGPHEAAVAKIRAGEAAGKAAAIAHQVHGAIGFTYEHDLHFLTKRLWSWRSEFGSESEWAVLLGRAFAGARGEALWPALTARFA